MQNSDIAGIFIWGIFAGLIAFAVLHHNLKQPQRTIAIRWCISAGVISIIFFAGHFLLGISPFPARALLGLGFIAPPALICGLLLAATDYIHKHKSTRKNA